MISACTQTVTQNTSRAVLTENDCEERALHDNNEHVHRRTVRSISCYD